MKTFAGLPLLVASVVAFLTPGCCAPAPAQQGAEVVHAQWSGPHSPAEKSATLVIRTAGEWTALWRRIGNEPPRPIDAKSEIAVAIFIGERRTGGYGVELVAVRTIDNELVVEYRERTPPPNSMVPQVITSPWVVGVLPFTDASIQFVARPSRSNAKP